LPVGSFSLLSDFLGPFSFSEAVAPHCAQILTFAKLGHIDTKDCSNLLGQGTVAKCCSATTVPTSAPAALGMKMMGMAPKGKYFVRSFRRRVSARTTRSTIAFTAPFSLLIEIS
jgi:hypothetical protein